MQISKKLKSEIKEYLKYTDEDFKKLNKEINKISKVYGNFKLKLFDPNDFGNELHGYNYKNVVYISVGLLYKRNLFMSTLFHEIGHLYCKKYHLFYNYHFGKNKRIIFKNAYRAEKWVDNWAKKEMKKWMPKERFIQSYLTKSPIEIIKIKKFIREFVYQINQTILV